MVGAHFGALVPGQGPLEVRWQPVSGQCQGVSEAGGGVVGGQVEEHHVPSAVGADTAGGGGVAGRGPSGGFCSRRVRMRSVRAWVGMRRARPRVIEASCPVRSKS